MNIEESILIDDLIKSWKEGSQPWPISTDYISEVWIIDGNDVPCCIVMDTCIAERYLFKCENKESGYADAAYRTKDEAIVSMRK